MLTSIVAASLLVATDSCRAAREFAVATPDGHTIAALLETSTARGRRPAIVLISGAGPHTRDYSTAGSGDRANHAFAVLSRALVQRGFAVVRFDERGTGRSTGDYQRTATTTSLAADVEALILELARQPEVDPTRMGLIGHSEGGAIAPLVASRHRHVSALVLLAAPSWTGRRIMDWQDAYALTHGDWSDLRATDSSRQAWLGEERRRRESTEAWFPFFLDYNPLPAIRSSRAATLILHGRRDVHVLPEQAEELAAAARAAGNRRVTLELLAGHDHTFGDPDVTSWPPPLSEKVIDRIGTWLAATLGPRRLPVGC